MTLSHPLPCFITTSGQWVVHPQGSIFTRRWRPRGARAEANPIVLLHDSLGCVELWRDFPAELCRAAKREVIAYDRLGFGRSDPRVDRPSLDFVREEALVYFPIVCEQLDVRSFVLLGHSVGGGMTIQCAAELAARCEAVVSLSAQVFPEDRTLEGLRAAREQFRDPQQVERLAKYHGDKARWVLDAWIGNWLSPDFADGSLAEVLPRVRCPVLAIHGGRNEYGSLRHPELIGELCRGPTQVEILPDVGHIPQREQPAEVLRRVMELLAN